MSWCIVHFPVANFAHFARFQGIRPVEEAYPSYSQVLNFHGPSAATAEARINALRTVPAEQLLKTHNECHRFGGVNLTIETGPNATWTEATLERLRKGEWDPWIESVILGTTEDEGTMFTLGMRVSVVQRIALLLRLIMAFATRSSTAPLDSKATSKTFRRLSRPLCASATSTTRRTQKRSLSSTRPHQSCLPTRSLLTPSLSKRWQ